MSRKSNRDFLYIESEADDPYWVPGVRIPHFPQSVEFGKLNKMQKGMEVIDFHFFVGNSACWEFIIIKVLWFTKRKGAYTLSFVFCLVGRTEALHRMPPAGIRVFEVGGVAARCPRLPHFPQQPKGCNKRCFLLIFNQLLRCATSWDRDSEEFLSTRVRLFQHPRFRPFLALKKDCRLTVLRKIVLNN